MPSKSLDNQINSSDFVNAKAAGEVDSSVVYVLDTSVLIADPDCLWSYPGVNIVIPLIVIEELDKVYKTRDDAAGAAARLALKNLEKIRLEAGGSLNAAVELKGGGSLRVETNGLHLKTIADLGFDVKSGDNRILAAAIGLKEAAGKKVTLVSADTGMRIKAAQVGVSAVDFERNKDINVHGDGWYEVLGADTLIQDLYNDLSIYVSDLEEYGLERLPVENEYVVLKGSSAGALCVVKEGALVKLESDNSCFGLKHRNTQQRFALHALTDGSVAVVALLGEAGTGKTLLSVAAALELVVEKRLYRGVSVYRPVIPAGSQDVGFLPGTLEEKLAVWGGPILDALVSLTDRKDEKDGAKLREELLSRGNLELGSIAHMRGRSIANRFLIIDEAQNLSSAEIKLLISRVSEGTKIVLTGDHTQIDAKYLSARNNGLAAAIEAFRGNENFAFVRLTRGERSKVADMAATLL